MGFFDDDDIFGGLFDFDNSGDTDVGEELLGLSMAGEILDEEFSDDEDEDEDKYEWRDYCEDGSEFDVDPEDFETEEEYNSALETAMYAWRDYCEDGSDYGIYPEDYDTLEEYLEDLEDAKDEEL